MTAIIKPLQKDKILPIHLKRNVEMKRQIVYPDFTFYKNNKIGFLVYLLS